MSKAINRQAIVDRVIEGVGIPASQFCRTACSASRRSCRSRRTTSKARRSSWPRRATPRVRDHDPFANNRYIKDKDMAQAVARCSPGSASRRGRRDAAERLLLARKKLEFSFMLVGWGSGTGGGVFAAEVAAGDLRSEEGLGPVEPRPLLKPEDGQAARPGAPHGRHQAARKVAAGGDRGRHQRRRHRPDSLRGLDLGGEEGPRLQGQHQPVHARQLGDEGELRTHRIHLPPPLAGEGRGGGSRFKLRSRRLSRGASPLPTSPRRRGEEGWVA